ncbi:MAG: DNA alkylation repair protein [Ruminococcaceae bacterium]|nr:DNA alkylation repair protein [Oscillospiraceae bacterium]
MQKELFKLQDLEYKAFHSRLMPNINPDLVIGVRTPQLKKLAKQIKNTDTAKSFINNLPHKYYEENNLHAFLISQICDFDICLSKVDDFLPYIDNWATCDGLIPKCFKSNTDKLLLQIKKWILSNETYTVRFAIKMLMSYYLDDNFDIEFMNMVSSVKSDEYYVNMMIAWYFATALYKQYDSAVLFLKEKRLSKWVHNKTIQKAVESYRVSDEKKTYLKSLKIK